MRKQLVGIMQIEGGKPSNVQLNVFDEMPLVYSIRDLPVSSSSNTVEIDLGKSNFWHITLTENVTTFTIIGPMVDDERWDWEIQITQDSTARTWTWAAKYVFAWADTPTIPTGSGEIITVRGYTRDGGTTHYCTYIEWQ